MKPFNDYYEHQICGVFLPALINGDYSGLNRNEAIEFDIWLENNHVVGSVYDVEGESSNFAVCDVCDLQGDVYLVKQHFYNDNITA
jgi:hypothetical protein